MYISSLASLPIHSGLNDLLWRDGSQHSTEAAAAMDVRQLKAATDTKRGYIRA